MKKLYNPSSNETVDSRRIIGGNPSGNHNPNKVKYKWATKLFDTMFNNTWTMGEVDTTSDVSDYKSLSVGEKNAYDKTLAQLIFMDSLQTNNLMDNINPHITATEVNMCLARQANEEALHSRSYEVLVESISTNTDHIYELWKSDPVLESKNSKIAKIYSDLSEEPNDSNLIKAMVANQILEGLYFYPGFVVIFALARNNKMLGSSQMIRFIMRDELTHLSLFQNMIKETMRENSNIWTNEFKEEIRNMFREAVELESEWGAYITDNNVLGLTNDIIKQYVQYLADSRLKAIGLNVIYDVPNPIKWVTNFSSLKNQKTNFFEGNVTNYSMGSLDINDF